MASTSQFKRKAPAPRASLDFDHDITSDVCALDQDGPNSQWNSASGLDFQDLLDGGSGGREDTDEAFIALKQASSFRKTASQGKTSGKKGGGFQTMGLLHVASC